MLKQAVTFKQCSAGISGLNVYQENIPLTIKSPLLTTRVVDTVGPTCCNINKLGLIKPGNASFLQHQFQMSGFCHLVINLDRQQSIYSGPAFSLCVFFYFISDVLYILLNVLLPPEATMLRLSLDMLHWLRLLDRYSEI